MSNIAAVQLNSGPNVQANLLVVSDIFEQISKTNAKIVVLPENFSLMPDTDDEFLKNAEDDGNGSVQNFIRELASKYDLWVVAGTIPTKTKNPKKVSATTYVYDNNGDTVYKYNKIHLFDVKLPDADESYNESETFNHGKDFKVIETPIGITGIACCYDLRFPELFRLQHKEGVETFILPAAFTEQTGKVHWETLVKARAIENLCYFVASCQDGYHISGRQTHGNTIIVNPWGQVLQRLDSGNGFIINEINRKQLQSIREKFPVLKHIRLINK